MSDLSLDCPNIPFKEAPTSKMATSKNISHHHPSSYSFVIAILFDLIPDHLDCLFFLFSGSSTFSLLLGLRKKVYRLEPCSFRWIYPSSSCIPPQCGGHPRPELRPLLILSERDHKFQLTAWRAWSCSQPFPHAATLTREDRLRRNPPWTHTWSLPSCRQLCSPWLQSCGCPDAPALTWGHSLP